MALYLKAGSSFWWMLLEGHGRKRESTGIRCDASAPEVRKANKAEAEKVYHARMVQLARGRVGLPVDTGETFGRFSVWYETHHTGKQRSATRSLVILKRLRAHFAHVPLAEIRPGRWKEYETQRLKDGVVLNTIGRELAVMKAVLAAAVGEHIDVSPLAHVKRKTVKLTAKRTLTKAEEVRLLEQLLPRVTPSGHKHDRTPAQSIIEEQARQELRDLYLVGVGTLLRQMNLINLQRRDYHVGRLVVQTKTGPHQVSLTGPTTLQSRAALILKRRLPTTHVGYFFPLWQARFARNRDGGNAKFLAAFRAACKRAGIPWGLTNQGVVWHTATRASGATRLLREHGIDLRTVQVIGNWRSLDQMAEYLGVDLGAPAKAVATRSAVHRG